MEFQNVKLIGAANVYFNGAVSSRTFYEADGQKKTLGLVTAGEYTFSTEFKEHMEILNGSLEVKLPGEDTYTEYKTGDVFDIPAGIQFKICTASFGDYCCTYLAE